MRTKALRPGLSTVHGSSPGEGKSAPKPKAPEHTPEHKAALKAAVKFAQTILQPSPQPKHKAPEHKAPEHKAPEHPAVTAALNFVQTAFQPPPQPKPKAPERKAPEHKPASSSFAPKLTAAMNLAQAAFQPSPQPKPKAPKHKPAFASFASFSPKLKAARKLAQTASQAAPAPKLKAPKHKPAFASFGPKLKAARKLAQAAFQAAPAPSSGGWSSVAINRNGTFTLPLVGTFPLPAAGKMEKIPLQDGKFFKIRQRADGAYEGKFGPDSQPAPKQSQPAPKQPLPARLEDRKKDAGGWAQIEVDRDGMIRVPGIAQPLYRPKPGQTDSVPVDAKTTFRFRQGADGDVYGTFETKAPSQPPPGWQRVNVDPDGMIRLPGHAKSFYPPQPGKTESIQLDDKTTFILSQAEDGEIYGTFETAAPPPEDQPGLDVDESKRAFEGVVSTRQMEGKKVVDVGSLGTLVAPAPGGTDAYLLAEDKLLVLDGNADGTVKVSTRQLGIENTSDGFKGALLPPANEKLVFAGRSFEVSKLKNGEKIKKHGEIDGKRFALEVRKNHDGTVTVTGRRDAGILNTMLGWAGKLLPILGTIPGLGVVALAAKVLTVFNAVKGFAQSVKNGNWLGMAGSLASGLAGLSQGAFQAFASKVANIANVGQQVMTTLKHGLGNGLLQVVSNGANLVSGIAQAAADLGQGGFRSEANNLAQATGTVAGYAGGADSALKGDLAPLFTQVAGDVVQQVVSNQTQRARGPRTGAQSPSGVQQFSGTPFTPFDPGALPSDPALDNFSPGTIESPASSTRPTPWQAAMDYALDSVGIKPVAGQPSTRVPSNVVAGPGGFDNAVWDYLGGLSDRLRGFGCAVTANPLSVFGVGAKCGTEAINEALGLGSLPDNDNTRRGEIAGVVATLPFLGQALEKNILTLAQLTNPAYNGRNLEVLRALGRGVSFGTTPANMAFRGGSTRNTTVPRAERMLADRAGARQPRFSDYCGHCTTVNVNRAAGGNRNVSMWELVESHPPGAGGITVFEIRDILKGLGHKNATAIKGADIATWGRAVDQTGLPVIILRDGHFLTIDAVENGFVYFRDSTAGNFRAPVSSFNGKLSGVLINR
jgi:hypothetical protein